MKQAHDPHTGHSTILQKEEKKKKQCPSTIQHSDTSLIIPMTHTQTLMKEWKQQIESLFHN